MGLLRRRALPASIFALTLVVLACLLALRTEEGQAAASVEPSVGVAPHGASAAAVERLATGAASAAPPRQATARQPVAPAKDLIVQVRPGASVELLDAPGGKLVAELGDTTEFDSPTVLSVLERRGNWIGVPSHLLPNGELGWVKLDADRLRTERIGQSIVIDLSGMRGRLLRNGEVERSWRIGIGAPGSPTPTGRYSVTDELESGLNPVYGCCAIAISATQPHLPEGWTGGNRIAIHGTQLPLGAKNSNGCVHAPDGDLRAIIDSIPLGTQVLIRR